MIKLHPWESSIVTQGNKYSDKVTLQIVVNSHSETLLIIIIKKAAMTPSQSRTVTEGKRRSWWDGRPRGPAAPAGVRAGLASAQHLGLVNIIVTVSAEIKHQWESYKLVVWTSPEGGKGSSGRRSPPWLSANLSQQRTLCTRPTLLVCQLRLRRGQCP